MKENTDSYDPRVLYQMVAENYWMHDRGDFNLVASRQLDYGLSSGSN